jgi:hypothetical protein
MALELSEVTRAYHALPPPEQALFAAIVRAHRSFNGVEWKLELARRHAAIDAGREVSIDSVEVFLAQLEAQAG